MFKTKLVEIFFALSRNEQRALCRWVDSPFLNSRTDVQLLCYYLYEKAYKNRDLLQKERVYEAVYGADPPVNEYQLHTLAFFLLQQIEAFLIYQTQQQNPEWTQLALAQAFKRLGLREPFKKQIKELRRQQAKAPIQDARYYALQYQIELEEVKFLDPAERSSLGNMQEMVYALDVQYIAEKLKQVCFLSSHEAVYKTQYDRGLFQTALTHLLQKPEWLSIPAIGLYYYYYNVMVQTAATEKEYFFQQFKIMLLDKGHLFESSESRDLYMLAINYTIRHYNTTGNIRYLQEMLYLYKAGLSLGCLLDHKTISPFTFKNIAGVAMRLQELEWAQMFIDQYAPMLPPSDRDTYTHYALSKLAFTRHRYHEAMERLQKVEYSDIFLNLDAKVMLMKIYYELREYDVLETFLQSFEAFLRRKSQLSYHRELYKNMLSFLKQLLRLHPITPQKVKNLRTEIHQTAALAEKDWLLLQLDSIK